MRLIFLVDMGKAIGGGGYALYKFAEELAIMGHEIKIFGMSPENKVLKGRKVPDNISISDRPYFKRNFKGAGRIDEFIDRIYSSTVIRGFIRKGNVDFICGSLRTSAVIASDLAKKTGIRSANFVYETPPWMEHDLGARWFREYRGRFRKSWDDTKKAYLESDVLISNSRLSQEWCERWLATKKVDGYVYPGITLEDVDSVSGQLEKNQIVYVGRLNAYKNIDLLIRALSRITYAPVLRIIGNGEEESSLRKLAARHRIDCTFEGKISDDEKWKIIKGSMFMVFPSSHEGFGMPPMEALACSRPCLCSDKPIFREVYGDHIEYFKEGSLDDLIRKISALMKDADYRRRRGVSGRKYVEANFSWRKSAEKIEKILMAKVKAG